MSQRGVPLGDFYQILIICGQVPDQLCIKIWADSLKGFRTYGGIKFRGVRFIANF